MELDLESPSTTKVPMRMSIFGMGYVGCVTGACFAELGHMIVGVEPNPVKVDLINSGRSPIVETGLEDLIAKVVGKRTFRATTDWEEAIRETDMALVCVGTPSQENGSVDLRYVKRVCEQIGTGIATKKSRFTVVIRSTVLPGTMAKIVIPVLEAASGKRAGKDFGLCMHPEFLREGTSIMDFHNPAKTVIGAIDEASANMLASLYRKFPGPLLKTTLGVAEMVKYADNCFHALKVSFANEIGNICKRVDVDSHAVMDIFCKDTKLNLSPYYLKPGFAFGGSCLPKDLRALVQESRALEVSVPLLESILVSNQQQIANLIQKLLRFKHKTLGFFGLSFKGGTDDLRCSPIVEVIETLLGKGFAIKIFDRHVSLARLVGANKEYIEKEIPHLSKLMCPTAEEVAEQSDVVVISHRDQGFHNALRLLKPGQTLIDLVRMTTPEYINGADYHGICW